jgi:hypothetical protein
MAGSIFTLSDDTTAYHRGWKSDFVGIRITINPQKDEIGKLHQGNV